MMVLPDKRVKIARVNTVAAPDYLVKLWHRVDGLACMAHKIPPARAREKRWVLTVKMGARTVKTEAFVTFRNALRASEVWRGDFAAIPEQQAA